MNKVRKIFTEKLNEFMNDIDYEGEVLEYLRAAKHDFKDDDEKYMCLFETLVGGKLNRFEEDFVLLMFKPKMEELHEDWIDKIYQRID